MSNNYEVTVDIDSIVVNVSAHSKEEAMDLAVDLIQDDPNYFHELEFSVQESEVTESS